MDVFPHTKFHQNWSCYITLSVKSNHLIRQNMRKKYCSHFNNSDQLELVQFDESYQVRSWRQVEKFAADQVCNAVRHCQ